jgi:hypothetical protein
MFKPRVQCGLGKLLNTLSDVDRAEVQDALDDATITGAGIARVLERRYGSTVKQGVVTRHRSSGCSCG